MDKYFNYYCPCSRLQRTNNGITYCYCLSISRSPVFSLGASSSRCQAAGTITYTASATNTTGITYSLDAASLAGGNSINSTTGAVTYAAGWSGTTTITASAAGCNGPQTSTHTVTVNPSVGPRFCIRSKFYPLYRCSNDNLFSYCYRFNRYYL